MNRALHILLAGVSALATAASGCAQTETAGREVLRLGPYREAPVAPASVEAGPVRLKAGGDVLRTGERGEVATSLGKAFAEAVAEHGRGGESFAGQARLDRCRVRAGFGKQHTVYEAKCRAVLLLNGTPVVEVEGLATRRTRTDAVTEFDLEQMKEDPRNPAFDRDDTEAVLLDAAKTAARLLVDPRFRPKVSRRTDKKEELAVPERDPQRAAALRKLKTAPDPAGRAAAAVDLARWGQTEDADALLPLLSDPSPLVRRAAALALGELGAEPALVPLARQAASDDDPGAKAAAERARERLCAIYPRRTPSKSSTPGARVEGSTPTSSKKDSTWRQKDPCSKR